MLTKEKNTKLLIDFFAKGLSDEQKKEFLNKASSDPEFLKEFIKGIELEDAYQEFIGDKDMKEKYGENLINKWNSLFETEEDTLLKG